jgi:two-component system response regulator HydG
MMPNRSRAIGRPNSSDAGDTPPRESSLGLSAETDSALALRAAHSNCTILITGETGVGKGRLARWLHDNSARRSGPFIPVNCGAIPETLIDSQLFGHARGAFSGALTEHLGLIRAAQHGTLLLDEISELPPSAQNRLLRLLQDREVQPVGHSRPVIVDVRVFAATNADLAEAVSQRRFREDLFFRLEVIKLHVKPLRERNAEIPRLLDEFNAEFADLYRQPLLQFQPDAVGLLAGYHWPGNVRQLRTLVERLHVLCPGETISPTHLTEIGLLGKSLNGANGLAALDRLKLDQVRRALSDSGGSIARAARALGVHRSTIYRWLRGH